MTAREGARDTGVRVEAAEAWSLWQGYAAALAGLW